MPDRPTLDDFDARYDRRSHASATALFQTATRVPAVAACVGILILLAFIVTDRVEATLVGLLWLVVGGVLTLYAGVAGLVYAGCALRRRFEPPDTLWRAVLAIACPLITVGVAFACARIGLALADPSGGTPPTTRP